ncbi:hypothetical protein VI817_007372 [Penicillium citrinum]|nr:hypothetical protein VI817_007372 [Penicillium citrinum]
MGGEGYKYDDQDNCLNTLAGIIQIPLSRIDNYKIEHVVKLVTPALFLRDAALGQLPSRSRSMMDSPISATFVRQALGPCS